MKDGHRHMALPPSLPCNTSARNIRSWPQTPGQTPQTQTPEQDGAAGLHWRLWPWEIKQAEPWEVKQAEEDDAVAAGKMQAVLDSPGLPSDSFSCHRVACFNLAN